MLESGGHMAVWFLLLSPTPFSLTLPPPSMFILASSNQIMWYSSAFLFILLFNFESNFYFFSPSVELDIMQCFHIVWSVTETTTVTRLFFSATQGNVNHELCVFSFSFRVATVAFLIASIAPKPQPLLHVVCSCTLCHLYEGVFTFLFLITRSRRFILQILHLMKADAVWYHLTFILLERVIHCLNLSSSSYTIDNNMVCLFPVLLFPD